MPEVRDAFGDLIRAWTNWQPFILNYFEHPVTNAYTESLNNLIRVMNRLGRGYSFEALRAKILFTEGVHKKKLARPKFERRREAEPAAMDMMATGGMFGWAGAKFPGNSARSASAPTETENSGRNYGADINTLIRLLEEGKL